MLVDKKLEQKSLPRSIWISFSFSENIYIYSSNDTVECESSLHKDNEFSLRATPQIVSCCTTTHVVRYISRDRYILKSYHRHLILILFDDRVAHNDRINLLRPACQNIVADFSHVPRYHALNHEISCNLGWRSLLRDSFRESFDRSQQGAFVSRIVSRTLILISIEIYPSVPPTSATSFSFFAI